MNINKAGVVLSSSCTLCYKIFIWWFLSNYFDLNIYMTNREEKDRSYKFIMILMLAVDEVQWKFLDNIEEFFVALWIIYFPITIIVVIF